VTASRRAGAQRFRPVEACLRISIWSEHVGDPVLQSNRTRRMDFAQLMVGALTDPALAHPRPALTTG